MLGHDLHSNYGPTADTGGLMANHAPTIYAYAEIDALIRGETAGGAKSRLPGGGGKPVTGAGAAGALPSAIYLSYCISEKTSTPGSLARPLRKFNSTAKTRRPRLATQLPHQLDRRGSGAAGGQKIVAESECFRRA